jgi:hypothetical protein
MYLCITPTLCGLQLGSNSLQSRSREGTGTHVPGEESSVTVFALHYWMLSNVVHSSLSSKHVWCADVHTQFSGGFGKKKGQKLSRAVSTAPSRFGRVACRAVFVINYALRIHALTRNVCCDCHVQPDSISAGKSVMVLAQTQAPRRSCQLDVASRGWRPSLSGSVH